MIYNFKEGINVRAFWKIGFYPRMDELYRRLEEMTRDRSTFFIVKEGCDGA